MSSLTHKWITLVTLSMMFLDWSERQSWNYWCYARASQPTAAVQVRSIVLVLLLTYGQEVYLFEQLPDFPWGLEFTKPWTKLESRLQLSWCLLPNFKPFLTQKKSTLRWAPKVNWYSGGCVRATVSSPYIDFRNSMPVWQCISVWVRNSQRNEMVKMSRARNANEHKRQNRTNS